MLVLPNKCLLKLTVDNVITKNENTIRVLFLATEDNTILKYMLINFLDHDDSFNKIKPTNTQLSPTLCLLAEIEIFESNSKQNAQNLINNLVFLENSIAHKDSSKFVRSSRNLLIATKYNLIKMPVANCESHTNYFSCLSLMDPYWLVQFYIHYLASLTDEWQYVPKYNFDPKITKNPPSFSKSKSFKDCIDNEYSVKIFLLGY